MNCSENLRDPVNQQLLTGNNAEGDSLKDVKIKVESKLEECDFENNYTQEPILNQSISEDGDIKIESHILKHETSYPLDIVEQDLKDDIKKEVEVLDLPLNQNDQEII
ncbi:uncharacterized protein [Diabrotica undecimpunctata]|uniref:uncharacterized protein isoform X2 n=1 Tax=Diabrotica undecimpunctata TaxID=50387 RepID=UPI003B639913